MFYSEVSIRDTHNSPKMVCRLADSFRRVSKLGKTRIIEDARRGVVRNTGFCGQNCCRLFYPELSGIGFWKYPLSPSLPYGSTLLGRAVSYATVSSNCELYRFA